MPNLAKTFAFLWLTGFLLRAAPCLADDRTFAELQNQIKTANLAKEIHGHFEQTKLFRELDVQIKTQGQFSVSKGTQGQRTLHWDVEQPEPSNLCIDQEKLVTNSPKKQVLRLSEMSGNTYDQIIYLLNIMAMNIDFMKSKFTLEKIAGHYELKPIAAQGFLFEKVLLELKADGQIVSVQLFEKSKDQIDIKFRNVSFSELQKAKPCL